MYALLDDKKIFYSKKGSRKCKCVVLLHGFLENYTIWDEFIDELSDDWLVIAIDLPGHGKTETLGEINTMLMMAGAVDCVLDKEGVDECVVVGHSMGGYVALEYAKTFSNCIKGLCLFNSTATADSDIKKKERNQVIKVLEKNARLFYKEAIPNLFMEVNRKPLKKYIDELIEEAGENEVEGIIACTKGMRDRKESIEFLKKITIPVLYIIGRRDKIIPFEKYKDQLYLNDNISAYISSCSGHMGFIEDKKGTFAALNNFLEQVYLQHD